MNLWLLAGVAALNLPLLLVLGRVLFGGWRKFWEAVEGLFVSDLTSALTGQEEYRAGKVELLLLLAFAVASTAIEYYLVAYYLFGIEKPWKW